jgi:hypothetical protein
MGSMQWQLGREEETIPAFASRTLENQENLGRDEKAGHVSRIRTNQYNEYNKYMSYECDVNSQ